MRRAAPLVFSMWPSKIKLNEEKSKHVVLDQQNEFHKDANAAKRQSRP
jgi:hypothetical protein